MRDSDSLLHSWCRHDLACKEQHEDLIRNSHNRPHDAKLLSPEDRENGFFSAMRFRMNPAENEGALSLI